MTRDRGKNNYAKSRSHIMCAETAFFCAEICGSAIPRKEKMALYHRLSSAFVL